MKKFNLQEYLSNPSRKIITRDGKPVRIICIDAKCNYPIVALVTQNNYEVTYNFKKDGFATSYGDSNYDLFFAPEKREGYINLFKQTNGLNTGFVFNTKEEAEKSAKGLSCYITTIKIEWEE